MVIWDIVMFKLMVGIWDLSIRVYVIEEVGVGGGEIVGDKIEEFVRKLIVYLLEVFNRMGCYWLIERIIMGCYW